VLKKLEDIEKASSNSTSAATSASVPLTNQSADVLNTVDRQGDESADDSLFIQSTPLTSRTMLSGLASTTVHKRRHHYISDDSSNEYTSDDTDDDSGATRMDSKRRSKNQKRASLTIRQARIRAIQKMDDDDMKLFNPALPKHGKAVDAPDIKSVQVIRNCIATMTQLAVQYLDSESARSAVKYLGQLDSLCREYHHDACVPDLLDLDMHCRRRMGRWKYSDTNETVRQLIRQLTGKMLSSTHTERERAYNGGSKFTSRQQRNSSTSYGKSASYNNNNRYNNSSSKGAQPCFRWNGKDAKAGVWTSVSQCDNTEQSCRYSHVCSQCHGNHQRFTKESCKATERDASSNKRD
jgi:hypothetical protein